MILSIVTISFNQKAFLADCIESVLSQKTNDVEYIVVDPGSTDGSRELINKYTGLIKVYEKDEGPAHGLNNGFKHATGHYFYFLNADDVLMNGAIAIIKERIDNERKKGLKSILMFQGYLVDENLRKIRPLRSFNFNAKRFVMNYTSIFQQGMVFPRESFESVGGFNADNRTCWDAELAVRISLDGWEFLDVSDKIALFRFYENSITGSGTNYAENKINRDRLYLEVMGSTPHRGLGLFNRIRGKLKYLYFSYLIERVFYMFRIF